MHFFSRTSNCRPDARRARWAVASLGLLAAALAFVATASPASADGSNKLELDAARSDPHRADATEAEHKQIEKLIDQLGDSKYWVRSRAADQIRQFGLSAFDDLTAAQTNPDLEISSAARRLLMSIPVPITAETDHADVRRVMKHYESLDPGARVDTCHELGKLLDGVALEALCRIVRFEKSQIVSKQAALVLLADPTVDNVWNDRGFKIMHDTLGNSRCPGAQWLRAEIRHRQRSDSESLDAWSKLIAAEVAAMQSLQPITNSDIVDKLLRLQVERAIPMERTQVVADALRRINDFVPVDHAEGLTDLVIWLAANKQWSAIAEIEKKSAETITTSIPLRYAIAHARRLEGKRDEAEKLSKETYDLTIGDADDRYSAGRTLRAWSEYEWAKRELTHVLESLQYSTITRGPQTELATMLHDIGRHREAAQVFERGLPAMERERADSDLIVISEIKGNIQLFLAAHYEAAGDRKKQVEHLEAALKIDPRNADVLIALYHLPGTDDAHRERIRTAIRRAAELFRNQIAQGPERGGSEAYANRVAAQPCNQLAWLIGNTEGDYQEAVNLSRRSLSLAPGEASYLDTLGRCSYAANDLDRAIRYQSLAVKLDPSSKTMQRQLDFFRAEKAKAK